MCVALRKISLKHFAESHERVFRYIKRWGTQVAVYDDNGKVVLLSPARRKVDYPRIARGTPAKSKSGANSSKDLYEKQGASSMAGSWRIDDLTSKAITSKKLRDHISGLTKKGVFNLAPISAILTLFPKT